MIKQNKFENQNIIFDLYIQLSLTCVVRTESKPDNQYHCPVFQTYVKNIFQQQLVVFEYCVLG